MASSLPEGLVVLFACSQCSEDAKRRAASICAEAGFERIEDFENADTTSLPGVEHLPPVLRRAIPALPALAARLKLKRKSLSTQASETAESIRSAAEAAAATERPARGPCAAAAELQQRRLTRREGDAWIQQARAAAIVGSAPRCSKEVLSVLKAWTNYSAALGRERCLPPEPDALVAWSSLFRFGSSRIASWRGQSLQTNRIIMICALSVWRAQEPQSLHQLRREAAHGVRIGGLRHGLFRAASPETS